MATAEPPTPSTPGPVPVSPDAPGPTARAGAVPAARGPAPGPSAPGDASARRSLLRDTSVSAVVAGFVAVLVSYTGPFLIVLQAADGAGLSVAETTSWVWAISFGSGLTCLVLSWATRQPVITAWSTPGAALLVTTLGGYRFSDVIGAYLVAGVVATVLGFSGLFGRLLTLVPRQVLSAMLAGVLLPFVLAAALAVGASPLVAGGLVAAFLVGRRVAPRYAVLGGLVVGVLLAVLTGELGNPHVTLRIDGPHLTAPTFDLGAVVGIGLPLLVVTMASQNAPGLTVLRNDGYDPDDRLLVGSTAAVWTVLAPFGAHGINLAAITAAICTGREAHHDPHRRYVAGVWCGVFYLALSLVSSGLVALFVAIPGDLVAALAGVALLGALLGATKDAFSGDGPTSEAALVTLAVTASGLTVLTVASPFWGLVAGGFAYVVLTLGRRARADLRGPAAAGRQPWRAAAARRKIVRMSTLTPDDLTYSDVPKESRFEARTAQDALVGLVGYQRRGGALVLTHTEVEDAAAGHGVGSSLARFALDQARSEGVPVVPLCPFVREYVERHPEYADLVQEPPHREG
ncbi:benzoate/H(+) symporter BenE family transporter [Cellulomonas sp. 179-A 4D5 NHS]|uniref:benzoate/H(+) symporter BenE family transporter n=1 Tax=Cellulomonas sp. 179-A 4D5 NHS TaxID=3142378 RepID=UPI0039A22CA2